MAVTVQDLLNDPRYKDNKSLLLLARPDIVQPKPRKKKKQKSTRELISNMQKSILNLKKENKSTRQLLLEFIKEQKAFNIAISQKLDKIVELNNLKTE
ncbi:MAG: hypothetical protein MJ217_02630 [Bacilli bacterium]|nr:hypothetical protein [Bacilli bacterium]